MGVVLSGGAESNGLVAGALVAAVFGSDGAVVVGVMVGAVDCVDVDVDVDVDSPALHADHMPTADKADTAAMWRNRLNDLAADMATVLPSSNTTRGVLQFVLRAPERACGS